MTHGFGRRFAPDPRDQNFPLRALLPAIPSTRVMRYWNANGWWGDQGTTSQCVAYAWLHWLEDGPVMQRSTPPPIIQPEILYHDAQDRDEWEGRDYEGTSTRGGVQALRARGLVGAFHWAQSLDDVVRTVLDLSPVVAGTNWTADMEQTDREGFVHATGATLGGHEYVINGVNTKRAVFRIKNSWGRSWGVSGLAYLSFEDLDRLLFAQDGEVCLATEIARPPASLKRA